MSIKFSLSLSPFDILLLNLFFLFIGDRLRIDLRKKDVPAAKMVILEQKFDEVRQDGLLLPSALSTGVPNDEPDNLASAPRPVKLVKRVASATASARKPLFEPPSSSGDTVAGAVTAEIFEACFEIVPQLTIFGQRDMDDHMKTIYTLIGDKNMDWEKRVDAVSQTFYIKLYIDFINIIFLVKKNPLAAHHKRSQFPIISTTVERSINSIPRHIKRAAFAGDQGSLYHNFIHEQGVAPPIGRFLHLHSARNDQFNTKFSKG